MLKIWFYRWWPFRLKSTMMKAVDWYERETERLQYEIDRRQVMVEGLNAKNVALEQQMTKFQRNVVMMVERRNKGEEIKIVPEGYQGPIYIQAISTDCKIDTRRLYLSRVGAEVVMALREDCPPEYIADAIAGQIRDVVLQRWRTQSVLNKDLK